METKTLQIKLLNVYTLQEELVSKSTRPRFCSSIKKIIKATEKTCHYEKQNKQKKKQMKKQAKSLLMKKMLHIFLLHNLTIFRCMIS